MKFTFLKLKNNLLTTNLKQTFENSLTSTKLVNEIASITRLFVIINDNMSFQRHLRPLKQINLER